MALVVETGACVPDANAFVTRAEYIAFAADYYPGTTVPDDNITDGAILRASAWLSSFPQWNGKQTCGRGRQGLAFPRTGLTDCDGKAISPNEVPEEVKRATFLVTKVEAESPGLLTPIIDALGQRKRVKVDVIEVEYADTSEKTLNELRPVLTAVADLLRCLGTFPRDRAVPWPWVA